MTTEERTLLTQELAAITKILCTQYKHVGYVMFGSKTIYEMEQRQKALAKYLYG